MTGREKVEAALSPGGTGEIPVVVCYEGIYVRDHWDELTDCPWWYQFSPSLEHQLAWRRDVIARTGQDWFYLPAWSSRAEREATRIEAGPVGVFSVDRRSGRWRELLRPAVSGWDPQGVSRRVAPARLPETVQEVDTSIPAAEPLDAERFAQEGRDELAEALLGEFGDRLFPIGHTASPLWSCYGLWGFEGMMLLAAQRPELVAHACRRYLDYSIRRVREAAALGAAGIWIEECFTDMISPSAFAALNVPFLSPLIQEVRRQGMKSIYYYCGNPRDRWGLIWPLGMDALALEEGKKGFAIEIEEVAARAAGCCAVLGNLDAVGVLQNGSEAELRAEIARQLAAGRRSGGRFIMSLGSPVTPGTPVRRVRLYCDLVRQLQGER